MGDHVLTVLETVAVVLGAAGVAVVAWSLIGGPLGVGSGLLAASLSILVVTWLVSRAQDAAALGDEDVSSKGGNQ